MGAHSRTRRKHGAEHLKSQGIAVREERPNALRKLLRNRRTSRIAVAAVSAFVFSVLPYSGLLNGQSGNDSAARMAHAQRTPIAATIRPHISHIAPSRQLSASDLPTQMAKLEPYLGYIKKYSSHTSFSPALLAAMAFAESAGNPSALSKEGASGIMQVEPNTALGEGVTNYATLSGSFRAGTIYIENLSVKYGLTKSDLDNALAESSRSGKKLDLVLAAYNAGEGAVSRYGGVPPFQQTRDYISKIRNSWTQILKKQAGRIRLAADSTFDSICTVTMHSAGNSIRQCRYEKPRHEDQVAQKKYIPGFSEDY